MESWEENEYVDDQFEDFESIAGEENIDEDGYEEEDDDNDEEELKQIKAKLEKKSKKRKAGRRGQWPDSTVDDLIDIIVDDEQLKEKLLLTNTKNVKNSQYFKRVIEELGKRCEERNETFSFDLQKTRQKFKRCVGLCRDAAMKIKTASGIKRFQEEKSLGNWFGKLLPIVNSMDNCQPGQSIEPGGETPTSSKAHKGNGSISNEEENDDATDSSSPASGVKRKLPSYVPTPSSKRKFSKADLVINDIKETVNSLKTIVSDNSSSKDILNFLKEESKQQAERDKEFFKLMGSLLQPQQPQPPTPAMTFAQPSLNQPFNPAAGFNYQTNSHFRYGMTSSTVPRPTNTPTEQHQGSYTEQLLDPNYP